MNVVSKTSWPLMVVLCWQCVHLRALLNELTVSVTRSYIFCGCSCKFCLLISNNFVTTSKPINCIPTDVGEFIANGVHAAAPLNEDQFNLGRGGREKN